MTFSLQWIAVAKIAKSENIIFSIEHSYRTQVSVVIKQHGLELKFFVKKSHCLTEEMYEGSSGVLTKFKIGISETFKR